MEYFSSFLTPQCGKKNRMIKSFEKHYSAEIIHTYHFDLKSWFLHKGSLLVNYTKPLNIEAFLSEPNNIHEKHINEFMKINKEELIITNR